MEKCKAILARPACALRSLLNKVNELVDVANLQIDMKDAAEKAITSANTVNKTVENLNGAVMHAAYFPCLTSNIIVVPDAAAKPIDDLRIFGKVFQNGGPVPNSPISFNNPGANGVIGLNIDDQYNINMFSFNIPGGLVGIPTGYKPTYTDPIGQPWLCDEIDVTKGIHIQRIKKVVFDGTSGSYSSSTGMFTAKLADALQKPYTENEGLCSHYPYGKYANANMPDKHWKLHFVESSGETTLYFKDSRFTSLDAWKEFLAANPVTVLYVLQEPVVTELPEAILKQFFNFRLSRGVNTISCSTCDMTLSYRVDNELYFD